MSFSRKWWWAAVAALAGAVLLALWFRLQRARPEELLARLPSSDQPTLYIDVELLRKTGVLDRLAGAANEEDPEYRKFVEAAGFDYRRDLDRVVLGWRQDVKWLVVEGRFQPGRLASYARQGGGRCQDDLCTVQGSAPERQISFLSLGSGRVAVAVSPDPLAAAVFREGKRPPRIPVGKPPAWLYLPPGWLHAHDDLPLGISRALANLKGADYALWSVRLGARGAVVEMEAPTPDAGTAAEVARRFNASLDLLRSIPGLPDSVRHARFSAEGAVARGVWPITE